MFEALEAGVELYPDLLLTGGTHHTEFRRSDLKVILKGVVWVCVCQSMML